MALSRTHSLEAVLQRQADNRARKDAQALKYPLSQPYYNQDTEEDHGIGAWIMLPSPLLDTIQHTNPKTTQDNDLLSIALKSEQGLHFYVWGIEQGAEERQRYLDQHQIVDLPMQNVRSARLRLKRVREWLKDEHLDISPETHRWLANHVRKAITLLSCGTNGKDCRQHGCGRDACIKYRWSRRKKTLKKNVQKALDNQDTKVILTLKTPFALPSAHPMAKGVWFPNRSPRIKPQDPGHGVFNDLTQERYEEHVKHRAKFTRDKQVRQLLGYTTFFTEVSFLTPHNNKHRYFPYPHTHFITSIPKGTSIALAKQLLSQRFALASGHAKAEVLVSVIKTPDVERIAGYGAKKFALSIDEAPSELPQGSDLPLVLDDRSLTEIHDLLDKTQHREIGSFNTRKSQSAKPLTITRVGNVLFLPPPVKPLKKTKGTDTHISPPPILNSELEATESATSGSMEAQKLGIEVRELVD